MTSLPFDVRPAPTGRLERQVWLASKADRLAVLARRGLSGAVRAAYTRWSDSLTASGDLAALNSIPHDWTSYVEQYLLDPLNEVLYSGIVTAWTSFDGSLPVTALDNWAAVVNEAAVSYMEQATNRLANVGQQVWRDVRAQAVSAVQNGDANEVVKARIQNATSWSEFRADTVARTETNGAFVQGELAAQRAFGDDGPIEKVWVAALDNRTRETHANAHDQCVGINEPFYVGGVAMDAPFDRFAPPGEVVNCRCAVEYLYPGMARPDGSLAGE